LTFTSIGLDDPLPLVYLELIDWDQTLTHDIPNFKNDHVNFNFIFFDNPKIDSHHELNNEVSTQGSAKSSSYKMNKEKERSNGENNFMVVSDQEKVKINSVSNGENLSRH
jgi:hypothetical protein